MNSAAHDQTVIAVATLVLKAGHLQPLVRLANGTEEDRGLMREVVLVLIELNPDALTATIAATLRHTEDGSDVPGVPIAG